MIIIKYIGRFGNNLFQYAFARILAESMGHGLDTYAGENAEYLPNCQAEISDRNFWNGPWIELHGNKVDITNIPSGNIITEGFFQRSEYYIPHRKEIKKWFEVSEIDFVPDDNDILLHIRRSDFGYKNNAGMLPLDFYGDILKNISFNKVYITGGVSHAGNLSDIDNNVIEYFKNYNPIYMKGNSIKTFRAIQKFKNVVQSMSTYCWWACFLSDKVEKVYTPITNTGYWSGSHGDIDLTINDSKYIYIKNINVIHS